VRCQFSEYLIAVKTFFVQVLEILLTEPRLLYSLNGRFSSVSTFHNMQEKTAKEFMDLGSFLEVEH